MNELTGVAMATTDPSATETFLLPEVPVAMVRKSVAEGAPSPTTSVPASSVNAKTFDDAVVVEKEMALLVRSTEAKLFVDEVRLTKARVSPALTLRSFGTAGNVASWVMVLPFG